MSKNIKFRLAAWSEAAGKYNPEAPLEGNEDNFYVDDDLQDDILSHFKKDEIVEMSDCGCLLAVADGMGGMNAGEVASEIAIATVKDYFNPLNPDTAQKIREYAPDAAKRKQYLETLIKDADKRLKNHAAQNQECRGMGSTIILAWIVGDKMTVSWCGDSRAYRYNPKQGITPLSKDHSLVQELVDRGVLTYEETFDHPQGNIVTRSLGDPSSPARPETKQYDVYNDDIILVCSDGLSGVLRDKETLDENGNVIPGQNIEAIIEQNTDSMEACRIALFQAAEQANWYDNVTVLLCQIISGAGTAPTIKRVKAQLRPENEPYTGPITNPAVDIHKEEEKNPFKKYYLIGGVVLLLILSFVGGALLFSKGEPTEEEITQAIERGDTIVFDESEGVTKIVTKEEKKEIEKKNKEIKEKKNKDKDKDKKTGDNPDDEPENIKTEGNPDMPEGNPNNLTKVNQSQVAIPSVGNGETQIKDTNTPDKNSKVSQEKKILLEAITHFPQYTTKLQNLIAIIDNPESNKEAYKDIIASWQYRNIAFNKLTKLEEDAKNYDLMMSYNDIFTKINQENYTNDFHRETINPAITKLEKEIKDAKKKADEEAEQALKAGGNPDNINEINSNATNGGTEGE